MRRSCRARQDSLPTSGRTHSAPERLDLAERRPRTKEECEHYARYAWAATLVRGEVLDVACGTGYGTRLLERRARVSGVDRDEEAIELARSRAAGSFVVAEIPPIPFADNAFDFVVCFETVEHIADDERFVREIRRVLRPGGQLLISTPNKDVSSPDGIPINPWHVREYTLASLTELLRTAGLELRDTYLQSFAPKIPRGHRIAWRLHGLMPARPGFVRSATRRLLGDAEVRRFSGRQPPPGFWIVNATVKG
jgi:SAM-dependent methyltransferase